LGESPTHMHLKLAVAEALKQYGYKTNIEKHFEGGRMDIHATNEETGEEMEIEIFVTNMPGRYVIRVVSGKLMAIDYELQQPEYEKKQAMWQSLLSKTEKPLQPLFNERDQFEVCERFLNLIQGRYGTLQKSPRILDALTEIFSFLRRKRTYY